MATSYDEMVGQKFGLLTVREILRNYRQTEGGFYVTYCRCDCDCGATNVIKAAQSIKTARLPSCGCMTKKLQSGNKKKHGESNTKAYRVWTSMKQRCYNPNHQNYADYGGRGIKVCDEWRDDFGVFNDWMIANGYTPTVKGIRNSEQTLDRIDVNGDYSPENCRLVSMQVQNNNFRRNHRVTYNGGSYTLAELGRELGVKYSTVESRASNGWCAEEIAMGRRRDERDELISCHSETHTIAEWSRILGMDYHMLLDVINDGEPIEEVIEYFGSGRSAIK